MFLLLLLNIFFIKSPFISTSSCVLAWEIILLKLSDIKSWDIISSSSVNFFIKLIVDKIQKTTVVVSDIWEAGNDSLGITMNGNNYVINGYYTEYKASTGNLDPIMNSDHYLILGGQVTNYKISSNDIIVIILIS